MPEARTIFAASYAIMLGALAVTGCGGADEQEGSGGGATGSGGTGSSTGTAGSGGQGSGGAGTGGMTSGGGGSRDDLGCDGFCEVAATCGSDVPTRDCLATCAAAPELNTEQCQAAYRERNGCVAALDCADYDLWRMPNGGVRPCSDEEIGIVDACASM